MPDSRKIFATSSEPLDGAGGLILSSRDRRAALSGRRAKPIFATVTSGFAPMALISGEEGCIQRYKKAPLCPCMGRGPCIIISMVLYINTEEEEKLVACVAPSLCETLSRLSDLSSLQHYIFIHIYSCRTEAPSESPCHGAAGCTAIHKNAPSFTSSLLPHN